MLSYKEVRPRARSFWRLEVPDTDTGVLAVHLQDLHCNSHNCRCAHAHLYVSKAEVLSRDDYDQEQWQISMTVNVETGAVEPPKQSGPVADWLYQTVRERLPGALLKRLRQRHQETRHEGWRFRDWSHLTRGDTVGYHEVFPDLEGELFRDGEQAYFIDDQYCVNPACNCGTVILTLAEIQGQQAETRGALRLELATGRVQVEHRNGCSDTRLRELLQMMFRQLPHTRVALQERARFMRGPFGEHLQKVLPAPATAPARATAPITPGRNESCWCGSGKKYKKCCLGKPLPTALG